MTYQYGVFFLNESISHKRFNDKCCDDQTKRSSKHELHKKIFLGYK